MRKIFLLCLFALPLTLNAKKRPLAAEQIAADSTWMMGNYTKQEISIPMRDGIKLFTAIYVPKDKSEAHPILMMRTPYSVGPYGVDSFRAFWHNHYIEYIKKNYIMVLQDVRGRFMSEGEFVDVRPFNPNKNGPGDIDEASDTYDTIDWLVKNVKNNNGRVGVYGISYPGFYATMAALSGHPALKAVSPQAPVTDWFAGDDFHHQGAFMMMDAFGFYSGFGKPRHGLITKGPAGFDFPEKDLYKYYLNIKSLDSLTKLMGDTIPFWKDLVNHPDYDDFWEARNTRNFVAHIPDSCATLIVGGLFDAEDCFGAWNLYKAIEKGAHNNNRLIMGPWAHGFWARDSGMFLGNVRFGRYTSKEYQMRYEKPFFEQYLRPNTSYRGGHDSAGVNLMPRPNMTEATVFATGANTWKTFNSWPPKEAQLNTLYMQSKGVLSFTQTSAPAGFSSYISDPANPVPFIDSTITHRTREYMTDDQRFASKRPDMLTFQTDVLTDDVFIAGPIKADLHVAITTTDADFIVKVIDVFPPDFKYNEHEPGNGKNYPMGGYQMLVRGEVFRGKYRDGLGQPKAFTPGKITEIMYNLPDVCHVFQKGHRIMVQVQSTWFPLVDRNPQKFENIYKAKPKDFVKSKITIYHDKVHPSNISFPMVPR